MSTIFKYFRNEDKIKYRFEKVKDVLNSKIFRPECQRYIEETRVSEMKVNFEQNFNPITPLYFCVLNNKRYIIDGQHRLETYRHFKKYFNEKIPIVEIHIKEKKEIYDYFLIINNQMALNDVWRQNEDIKEIILNTYNHFTKKYPYTFKLAKPKCRPYIGPNKFMSQLTEMLEDEELNLREHYGINTSKNFIDILENLNKKYSEQNSGWYGYKNKKALELNGRMIQKIKKNNGLYLGMLRKRWTETIINFDPPEPIGPLPQSTRFACWNKWIGRDLGVAKCWCCNENEISQQCFEAGHVQAKKRGGKNTIENLRPICGFCNRTMGIKNMFQFMKEMGYNHHDSKDVDSDVEMSDS